jgi:23S rRNA-/tRNA-specific pseudouridylate synthase
MAHEVRWIVRSGDGATVGEVVVRAFGDASAIREGRVFVGRVRAKDEGDRVEVGDVVTLGARRDGAESVEILAEEDGLIAVNKPPGLPTIADQAGASHSLLGILAKKLGCGPADLHPTSRLDVDVSGVVLFARTKRARENLAKARAEGAYFRRYVALASSPPALPRGEWDVPIGRANDPKRRAAFGRDSTDASSYYETVALASGHALLALEPVTGRTHQLRVHAAHARAPLLGDRAYGGLTRIVLGSGRVLPVRRVALHAARVTVPRLMGAPLEVRAPIPEELVALWRDLGGEREMWDAAVDLPRMATPAT